MAASNELSEFPGRYRSRVVNIGGLQVGGQYPIRIQSMVNTDTMNTEATVRQCIELFDAGCEMVRMTVPGRREAANLENIKNTLLRKGYEGPLIADIHFLPAAAEISTAFVEKVRINPGNYAELFHSGKITEADWAASLENIRERLTILAELCIKHDTVLRIGVNHGSLSSRILHKYGNTPEGMVESAMEYLSTLKETGFNEVVVSLKSSHAATMIAANHLMAKRMMQEGMDYPLHLGVTEAGAGEDGRIRSALGIGVLLDEGIGDTIRVSLTEDPVLEIPFAKRLAGRYTRDNKRSFINDKETFVRPDKTYAPRRQKPLVVSESVGGSEEPKPDLVPLRNDLLMDVSDPEGKTYSCTQDISASYDTDFLLLRSESEYALGEFRSKIRELNTRKVDTPVILYKVIEAEDYDNALIEAVIDLGGVLIEGEADGIWIECKALKARDKLKLMFGLLQATGRRITKAEFIACPSCGRTKFDIQEVLHKVKQKTSHLKGLKIAVMGCIVNGPGEMAGADYGYVGSGNGKVTLFRASEGILKNISEEEAIDRLVEIIKEDNRWIEP